MRALCINLQIHQPYLLRTYRFFDIGENHDYYDEYLNRTNIRRLAEKSFLPVNSMLLKMIKDHGSAFRLSFSISGTAIEQMEQYVPEVLDSFKKLAKTGSVEFVAETFSHSLSSLRSKEEFFSQVKKHEEKIERLFGKKPRTLRNSELIYTDGIGEMAGELGYEVMLSEGAEFVLGWKSPNYLYCNNIDPRVRLLLRNFRLSDDIAHRFSNTSWSEWPLTTEKFCGWLNALPSDQDVVNVFLDYPALGVRNTAESGIFDFLKALPGAVLKHTPFVFATPSEAATMLQPRSAVHVPFPSSWADEERDITAWLGNDLQHEAVTQLYGLSSHVNACDDESIRHDWACLQNSDHFYYMSTKIYSDSSVQQMNNPYNSPYDAFINYMNVLSDFIIRLEECGNGRPTADKATEIRTAVKQVPEIIPAALSGKKAGKRPAKKTTAKKPSAKK